MEDKVIEETKEKNWLTTFLLCLFLGNFGVHRFYTRKIASGIFQLLTAGGLGIWSLIDLILIASEKFKDSKGNYIKSHNKNLNVALIFCVIIILLNIGILVNDVPKIKALSEKLDNLGYSFEEYKNEDAKMQVFINLNATNEEIAKLGEELKQIEGIKSIQFISKEETLEEYINGFGDKGKEILEKYRENNLYPDSYVITLNNEKQSLEIEQKINSLSSVKNISNGYANIKSFDNVKTYSNSVIPIYKITIIITTILEVIKTILLIIATMVVIKQRKVEQE